MVGFIDEQIEEDSNQPSKLNTLKDPLGYVDPKLIDLSFVDTFLDFDSMEDWFQDCPTPDWANSGDAEVAVEEKIIPMVEVGPCGETGPQPNLGGSKQNEVDVSGLAVKSEPEEFATERTSSYCIADEMSKVNLVEGSRSVLAPCDKSDAASDVGKSKGDDEGESGSETESESSSPSTSSSSEDGDDEDDEESSSASSSSDDEDVDTKGDEEEGEKKETNVREFEEGEIRDDDGEMTFGGTDEEEEKLVNADKDGKDLVTWSDVEFDDADNEDGGAALGPIRSKNELQDLPMVPAVEVSLQPHHQLQTVGVVLSMMGAKVIVEGVEKHNPLDEGSILWVTESRSPLGLVDEIFGPVKNPYYVVRYNSESEVPVGIHEGSSISVVQDFANYVLNDKNLYKKGYDASGENDEALSEDAEFSDDEKEAEYRRRLKMSKRGMDDQKFGNKKNDKRKLKNKEGAWKPNMAALQNTPMGKDHLPPNQNDKRKLENREGTWKPNMAALQNTPMGKDHLPPNQNQHQTLLVAASTNQGNCSSTSAIRQDFPNSMSWAPPFQQMAQTTTVFPPSNGMWINGVPFQQPQSAVVPGGFTPHFMPWPAQNNLQHPHQMPFPMQMPFQQPFNPIPGSLPNFGLPGGQLNMYPGPLRNANPGLVGQNGFSQTGPGMSFQGQFTGPGTNVGQNGSSQTGSGMSFQGQLTATGSGTHVGDQASSSNVLNVEQNSTSQPSAIPPASTQTQQFNMGANSSRGRKGYRGGGRFGRGRGWWQSR
ncbi:H/ACA ribonucleoprotein complex non-core subunit NAF1-like [Tripterygium wilfordii]|uniref:H/ACA ribonucleoprotein complex non-core subunit NAF1 n=1 Tax=Tripterygium wilfordii TaxID=458696 RepID=A0A7J7D5A3_TRIWF|nr:H/ACA ribonucleoprotein complex non-core subunit NAF1-like [Tripterygium wilfordii]KAF5741491.1 H/ACA ribonucleoprotein complex non-core subunit NAF1-like [Tripterygium wilfordii]